MFKSFLLLLSLLFNANAFAHEGHHHADEDSYEHAASDNFFLEEGGPLPAGAQSYILLPDGSRYPLDSKFWRATNEMAKLFIEEEPNWYPAPWQRVADLVEEATHKVFWVRLSGWGIKYWKRYGKTAVALLAAGELIEHAAVPISGACVVVQAVCITSGKHIDRFWEMIHYRFPMNEQMGKRVHLSAKQLRWNWLFWRSMKKAAEYKPGEMAAAPSDSPMVRYYLAQEKIAFLDMQLALAEEAIDPHAETNAGLYLQLKDLLATMGKAIDRFSIYSSGLAVSGQPINKTTVAQFDKKFQDFFMDLNSFFNSIKRGQVPLTTPLGRAIWNTPRELLDSLRTLQKEGCEKLLMSGEDKPHEIHNPHHHIHAGARRL